MRKPIVVLGSTNTDMVITGRKIPAPGETVSGGKFMMNPGGKGANQAVAVARLSAKKDACTFIAKAVDCVAAGDTFNGAFAVALAEGKSCAEAIDFAQKASAISVTRPGAQSSVPYRREVE